jgi:hypothetical protein
LANVVIQEVVTAPIGGLLLFRWLGRDYEKAIITCPGFADLENPRCRPALSAVPPPV